METRRIGEYEIVSEIGRGGMGIVYKAVDARTGEPCALKLLRPDALTDADGESPEQTLDRFLREARAIEKLDHPGFVRVHHVGRSERCPCLCMDLVEGASLDRLLRPPVGEAPIPARREDEILRDVARAIGHAHARGIVQPDLKPENVLIAADGRPRITDFGLARDLSPDAMGLATGPGTRLGTPQYMSPEQVRADRAAIGVMLYEVLERRLPFQGKTLTEVFDGILKQAPTPPMGEGERDLPGAAAVSLRCLQKSPALRYANAEVLAADLDEVIEGREISRAPEPPTLDAIGLGDGGPAIGPSGRFRTVLLRPGSLVPDRVRRAATFLFFATLASTVLCFLAGTVLFREAGGLITVALLAFSMQEELVGVLEENRDAIWVRRASPWRANLRLAGKIVALFLGMFLGFGILTLALAESSVAEVLGPQLSRHAAAHSRIQGVEFGTPWGLFRHNALVLLGCFLFAFLFRAGEARGAR